MERVFGSMFCQTPSMGFTTHRAEADLGTDKVPIAVTPKPNKTLRLTEIADDLTLTSFMEMC